MRLRGGIDAGDGFVRGDGAPYLLLRECIPGTGMWGCFLYRLWPDRAPEPVLADGSWSD